jgi:FixJ family two-component response regulator
MSPTLSPAGKLVIVIDDDRAVLNALGFALEMAGFSSRQYGSAAAALSTGALDQAACLVIDQGLPDIQGLDLLAQLRRNGLTTPAIIITSSPPAAVLARARTLGAPVIEKPLLDDALFACIRRLSGTAAAPQGGWPASLR